ncbi:MAG: hypothetical protein H6858_08550 [Rhodospirillales bacterium]|nr:hypothetical protein [Alphaproteobacteria bacterium]MCB1838721.1 hypothetical protein [Alphaproteobacteria bacterium]MCB9977631.1 hypothetical protein [Rhodospirillales bacterium]
MRERVLVGVVALTLSCLSPAAAFAEGGTGKAGFLAQATWSAFECAVLANIAGDADEHSRLIDYGYDKGQKFMSELRGGKVKKEDFADEVPDPFISLLKGPSNDFILGRIYQSAEEEILSGEVVISEDDEMNLDEERTDAAQKKFKALNCPLIGH